MIFLTFFIKKSIDLLKMEIVIDHYQICVLNKDRIQKRIE